MSASSWEFIDGQSEHQHPDVPGSSSDHMDIEHVFVEPTSVGYPDQTEHLEILEETSKKTIDENKMAIGEKNIDENKMAIAENKLTPLEAHNLEVNLKECEMKPHIWEVHRLRDCAFCRLCERWYNLMGETIVNHEYQSRHQKILKAINAAEREKHLEELRKESIEYKKNEIIETLEDHRFFLRWQWLPLGHFLKIFKVDLVNLGETSREFLVAQDTDHHEVIFEALEWLDE